MQYTPQVNAEAEGGLKADWSSCSWRSGVCRVFNWNQPRERVSASVLQYCNGPRVATLEPPYVPFAGSPYYSVEKSMIFCCEAVLEICAYTSMLFNGQVDHIVRQKMATHRGRCNWTGVATSCYGLSLRDIQSPTIRHAGLTYIGHVTGRKIPIQHEKALLRHARLTQIATFALK
jgi:hypothetical protein